MASLVGAAIKNAKKTLEAAKSEDYRFSLRSSVEEKRNLYLALKEKRSEIKDRGNINRTKGGLLLNIFGFGCAIGFACLAAFVSPLFILAPLAIFLGQDLGKAIMMHSKFKKEGCTLFQVLKAKREYKKASKNERITTMLVKEADKNEFLQTGKIERANMRANLRNQTNIQTQSRGRE